MSTNTCNTCAHYQQHYAFDKNRIIRVHCGSCLFLKGKRRKPDSKACENYVLSEPVEEAFVTREYLSKALLEYVLELELLPKIYNSDDFTRGE